MKTSRMIIFGLKLNIKLIVGWSIAMMGMMAMYTLLFPYVQDMANVKMEMMPKEMMQLFGLDEWNDMSNFVSYLAMIYNLMLVAMSIFAVVFSSNLLANEEKNKTIEILSSIKISRAKIYWNKFITAIIGLLIVVISSAVVGTICGFVSGGETFDIMEVIAIFVFSSTIPFIFMAFAFSLAGITGKIAVSTVGSIFVFAIYLMGYLGTLMGEDGEFLKYFSPFEMFSPTTVIEPDLTMMLSMGAYAALMIVALLLGMYRYKKRDFVI